MKAKLSNLAAWAGLVSAGTSAVLPRDNATFTSACDGIKDKISLENVTVGIVEYVPAGSNISLVEIPSVCSTTAQQVDVDLCRVYMNVSTSDRSGIRLEAWFPRDFNGRFLSTGNGGLGGCIKYTDLAFGTKFGFATVGANNGHDGDTGIYFGNSEVLEDFAYRSVHTGVVVGKQVTDLFYESGYNKSYYLGCSTGGREGYKSVQSFPDDFDGVLAGSPAMNFVNLISWGSFAYYYTGSENSSTFVTTAQWTAVHEEVLNQCDEIDGAADGIIEDPSICNATYDGLLCNGTTSDSSTCLTEVQLNTVKNVLSNFYGPDGKLYYPRLNPGAEDSAAAVYYSGTPYTTGPDWYRYVVYNNTSWDPNTWTPEDAKTALEQNPFNIQTFDADISPFKNRGGKLMSYHGTTDPIISSEDTKLYYNRVSETMNMTSSELDEFYRFFGISGMGHCGSGNGASYIGQSAQTYLDSEPENNLLLKLVDWVENGVAPEYVRGARSADGETAEYFRKHCRYPRRNVYVGPGNYTDEDAWKCVE